MANISHFTQTVNGVSTTYDIHDANAIPLSGTITITGTSFFKSTSNSQLQIGSGTSSTTGGCLIMYGSEYNNTDSAGSFRLRARKTSNYDLLGKGDGTLTWGSKNVAMAEDVVPKAGGAVLSGRTYSRTVDNDYLTINGSSTDDNGAFLRLHGKNYSDTAYSGVVLIRAKNALHTYDMTLKPNGELTWGAKNVAMQEDVVPRSGGNVMTGSLGPATSGGANLGDSTHKWSNINGVAVDNIGFPGTSAIDVSGSLSNYTIGGEQNIHGKYYIPTASGFASARFYYTSNIRFTLQIYKNYNDLVSNGDPIFALPYIDTFEWETLPAPAGSCILIKLESAIPPSDMGNTGWTLRIYTNKGL